MKRELNSVYQNAVVSLTMRNKLSSKEELFCRYCSDTLNGRWAAANAGYTLFPQLKANLLLRREEIRAEIKRLLEANDQNMENKVAAGFQHVAFGSVADCVHLLLSGDEITLEELEKMDLFMISEIKRPRENAMEIKFFDRIKALEMLYELSKKKGEPPLDFFHALEKSASELDSTDA